MGSLARRVRGRLKASWVWLRSQATLRPVEVQTEDPLAFFQQAEMARRTLEQIAEAPTSMPTRVPVHLKERAARLLVERIVELATFASLLLRLDVISVSQDPEGDHGARVARIRRRTDSLRTFVRFRPSALERAPQLGRWWTDTADAAMRAAIANSERNITAIEAGTIERRSSAEASVASLPLLPVAFGSTQETPEEVVRFCIRENITTAMFAVARFLKDAFPEARNLRLEVAGDPEGSEEWVDIMVDVRAADAFERYGAYVDRVSQALAPWESNKIRLLYNAVA